MNPDSMKRAVTLVLTAYVAFALVVVLYGQSAPRMAALVLEGTWASGYGIGQVLFKATPLLITGLAALVAFRVGLVNVGAEGQLALGGLCAAVVGARVDGVLALPLACFAGCVGGAVWALLPALLRIRAGVSELISTLMMNKIAESVVAFALAHGLAVAGTVRTESVSSAARLTPGARFVAAFAGSAVSTGLLLALMLALVVPVLMDRTAVGIEWRLVGKNSRACASAGVRVDARMLQGFLLSGALAGLAGSVMVLGYKGYFEQGIGAGAGFTGLAVGLMGSGGAMALGALLFGTLDQGGLAMNAYVPRDIMQIVIAAVIVAVSIRMQTRARSRPPSPKVSPNAGEP
jgi:general nucleoside transport system permease protein